VFKETASWGTPSGVTSTRHLPVSTFPSKSMPITRRNKNNCHVWDIPLMKPMKCHHVYPISPLFKPQKQGWNCSFLESNLLFFDVLNLQKREMFHVLNLKKWDPTFPNDGVWGSSSKPRHPVGSKGKSLDLSGGELPFWETRAVTSYPLGYLMGI